MDIATRVHNHNYRLDPIVRSLLDTDFYKLLMLQFIWKKHRDVTVTFAMKNRTMDVHLGDHMKIEDVEAQFDFVRSLRFTNSELIWLQGNTFYGKTGMFEPAFIEFLRTLQLPDYYITYNGGDLHVEFTGTWAEVTLWEIYALSIINELRNRDIMRSMNKFELDVMYAGAKTKLWNKFKTINVGVTELNLTDFGTRRRHSFLWQEWAVLAAQDALGDKFTGTSNAYLAFKHGFEAKGTNAHELPMVIAALTEGNEALKQSQYKVLEEWQDMYDGALRIALPDTFGTTQFLQDAPQWVADWTGFRFDSKDPIDAGEEVIAWWKARGVDPKTKLGLFSDGLDSGDIIRLQNHFQGRMRVGFGWGTLLTNDFRDCHPRGGDSLKPISLVCKVRSANGIPAVKLSDNYTKATGPASEVERYRNVFGHAGLANAPVRV